MKVNGEIGQRVLIDGSDVERGSHLNVNTVITPDKIAAYINNDEALTKDIIGRKIGDESAVFCLEFKVVPISAIKGIIDGKQTGHFKLDAFEGICQVCRYGGHQGYSSREHA